MESKSMDVSHRWSTLDSNNTTIGHLNILKPDKGAHGVRLGRMPNPEEYLYLSAFDVIAS
jgi:hypothetical protein